jgi:hypothetical protein
MEANDMRAYSFNQLREMGFDTSEFNQPDREGEYNAILVMKHWGRIANITGFFITESGEMIRANAWRNKSYLGLDEIELGTQLNLVFRKNSRGTIELNSSRRIRE